MKKIIAVALFGILVCVLAGCGCDHNWKNATCTAPQTCLNCGETQGTNRGHRFADATCTAAKTCMYCGETSGQPLDHSFADATFTAPKTCTVCGETEGSPLEKYVLTGAEYNRVNAKLEGTWEGYIGSSLVEYAFSDGEFAARATIGSTSATNYGTYEITNGTIEFYYQNGTHKTAVYELNGDTLTWDFPE